MQKQRVSHAVRHTGRPEYSTGRMLYFARDLPRSPFRTRLVPCARESASPSERRVAVKASAAPPGAATAEAPANTTTPFTHALARHDCAHRLRKILDDAGMAAPPALLAREARLRELGDMVRAATIAP